MPCDICALRYVGHVSFDQFNFDPIITLACNIVDQDHNIVLVSWLLDYDAGWACLTHYSVNGTLATLLIGSQRLEEAM